MCERREIRTAGFGKPRSSNRAPFRGDVRTGFFWSSSEFTFSIRESWSSEGRIWKWLRHVRMKLSSGGVCRWGRKSGSSLLERRHLWHCKDACSVHLLQWGKSSISSFRIAFRICHRWSTGPYYHPLARLSSNARMFLSMHTTSPIWWIRLCIPLRTTC